MWLMTFSVSLLIGALWGQAEIIDRIAVTVGNTVITESDVLEQMRVTAFLNGEPFRPTPEEKRKAAERLVDVTLIRREMEISRYPWPSKSEAEQMLDKLKQSRFPGDGYQEELQRYGISESDLLDNLLLQLTTLRFIEFRFRPAVALTDAEVATYYEKTFLPKWEQSHSGPPPTLDESRDDIEKILTQQRVDQSLDRWLVQARKQTRIDYHEGAFR
jgi:peptidyl-prolyl cis-trans isomerase SurA